MNYLVNLPVLDFTLHKTFLQVKCLFLTANFKID